MGRREDQDCLLEGLSKMQRGLLVSAVEEGAAAGKRRRVCMGLKDGGKAPGGRRRRASGGEATPRGSRAPGLPQDGPSRPTLNAQPPPWRSEPGQPWSSRPLRVCRYYEGGALGVKLGGPSGRLSRGVSSPVWPLLGSPGARLRWDRPHGLTSGPRVAGSSPELPSQTPPGLGPFE